MKKTIWTTILCLMVCCATAPAAWAAQDPDNPFPPVLPNPPELPAPEKEDKQEPEKEGPIVIDATQPSGSGQQQSGESLSELRPNQEAEVLPPMTDEPDQKILVREKFAGWSEAGTGAGGSVLGDQLRANWVMLGNNGLLQGRVLGSANVDAAKIPVYLLSRGRILTQTRTDADGNFSFSNVQQGTYSLVGIGQDAFFAFGLNAIDYAESIQFRMPDKIQVQAVQNKTTVNLDWIRYFAPKLQFRVYGRFVSQQGTKDPAALYGTDGLALLAPQSAPATSIQSHPVSLTEDGTLVGRVHQIDELNGRPVDVRGIRAILIQDDKVFGAASADNFGVFSIPGVTPGNYSIVAVGNDGMGCIGIEVVANDSSENARPIDFSLVSPETAGWMNHMATEIAYQRIVGRPRQNANSECQQCGSAIPSMLNGVCGQCGVCQECGVRTDYGMCGGCGTGCMSGGFGSCFGGRGHGGHGGCFGGGYGSGGYGGYGSGYGGGYGGYGGNGGGSASGFKNFWRDVNACFDICFYGETFAYGNGSGQGGYGGYGGGYGQGGYPYGNGMQYGNGYGMNPGYYNGGYPMQNPNYGMPYSTSLPNVYAPVVPGVPAAEVVQPPMVPTPADPHIGH